jgi:hypothetical protein
MFQKRDSCSELNKNMWDVFCKPDNLNILSHLNPVIPSGRHYFSYFECQTYTDGNSAVLRLMQCEDKTFVCQSSKPTPKVNLNYFWKDKKKNHFIIV